MTDGLSTLYQDLLGGSYDCVDRIVLNAYFRMGHDPGGFRVCVSGLSSFLESGRRVEPGHITSDGGSPPWLHPRRYALSAGALRSEDRERAQVSVTAVAAWRVDCL